MLGLEWTCFRRRNGQIYDFNKKADSKGDKVLMEHMINVKHGKCLITFVQKQNKRR